MQSKSQRYSDIVFKKVQALAAEQGESQILKRYKSLNKRAGGILRTVGLIQFLTFLAAKATKKSEIHHLYLLEHLREELFDLKIIRDRNQEDFLRTVRRQELPAYMRATSETLMLLQWHKRISDILISGTAEEE